MSATVDMLVAETGLPRQHVKLALEFSGDPAAVLALAVDCEGKPPEEVRRICVAFVRRHLQGRDV